MLHFWTEIGSQLPVFSQIRSTPQFVSHPSKHPNDESPRLGSKLGVQDVEVVDAAVEALPGQPGEFDLGDVQPGAVLGRVVDLQPLGEGAGFDGSSSFGVVW